MKWYKCPECGKRLFVVENGAVIRGVTVKCKQCKRIIKVSLEPKKPE